MMIMTIIESNDYLFLFNRQIKNSSIGLHVIILKNDYTSGRSVIMAEIDMIHSYNV